MYSINLAKVEDISRLPSYDTSMKPIKIGRQYVVALPVEDGDNSIYFGEVVVPVDVIGWSFQLKVLGTPNRIVELPAAVLLMSLCEDNS